MPNPPSEEEVRITLPCVCARFLYVRCPLLCTPVTEVTVTNLASLERQSFVTRDYDRLSLLQAFLFLRFRLPHRQTHRLQERQAGESCQYAPHYLCAQNESKTTFLTLFGDAKVSFSPCLPCLPPNSAAELTAGMAARAVAKGPAASVDIRACIY